MFIIWYTQSSCIKSNLCVLEEALLAELKNVVNYDNNAEEDYEEDKILKEASQYIIELSNTAASPAENTSASPEKQADHAGKIPCYIFHN